MKGDYLSVNEAASRLGVSRAAVYSAIREGRLESDVVLGKIAVTRKSLANYKPNPDRVRAGKIRIAQSSYVVVELSKTAHKSASEEVLNLDELSSGHYSLNEKHSIHLEFMDGSSRTYEGKACDALLRDLAERTNIFELARESGADLVNVHKVSNIVFSPKAHNEESVVIFQVLAGGKPRQISVRGSEAEAAWKELRRILKPNNVKTTSTQSRARTGT